MQWSVSAVCHCAIAQVPYRLHAVLVHEGQASAGHYWAYIYDHANQRWMKYNDVCITESSWDELERDSFGGITNASAYCLMYIDDRLQNLITGTPTYVFQSSVLRYSKEGQVRFFLSRRST